MTSFAEALRTADTWEHYYDLYRKTYEQVAQRCFLGPVTFGQHIHHSAVPDANGDAGGFLNWVVYSQPSARTLRAYLPVLAGLLSKEPHRSSSRYLLFSSDALELNSAEVADAMVGAPFPVDFWAGSMSRLIDAQELGALKGAELLFGDIGTASLLGKLSDPERVQVGLRNSFGANSRVPVQLRSAFSDSFFVLWAFERGMPPTDVIAILGASTWLASALARNRTLANAQASDYVQQCLARSPNDNIVHKVLPGETLGHIVRKIYGVSFSTMWPTISVLNPEIRDPDLIFPSQEIRLPPVS